MKLINNMKPLRESLLADIDSNLKKGNDIELCNRLFSKKQKEMNDAIIDFMHKIKNIKTNKVDPETTSINTLKRSKNYIVKFSVVDNKYNLSICKFMYSGIWNIINMFSSTFSSSTTITMYAWANWEDVLQQLLTVPDNTIIYEIKSDELNDLFDTIHNNAKEYIRD